MSTKIEWCTDTRNPVVGCSHCSPGCDNCYAERRAAILAKNPNPKIRSKYAGVVDEHGKWTGKTNFDASALTKLPKKPQRILVSSMCDMFHESVSFATLEHIIGHMALTRANAHHTFMLLTKRPDRMRDFFAQWSPYREVNNLWLGVTVCNQAEADAKIPVLLQTPAAKRFVSVEPMLGPVDLTAIRYTEEDAEWRVNCLTAEAWCENSDSASAYCDAADGVEKLDWVICGGETGPKARPMHPDWARSLRDQCVAAGVPFFFKGWGEWEVYFDRDKDSPDWRRCPEVNNVNTRYLNLAGGYGFHGDRVVAVKRIGKRRAGRLLDGREWNEVPA